MFKVLRNINWSELSGLLVGAALAITICVATIVLVLKLEEEGVLWKDEYTLYSNFVSGQGLSKGTKVQINGVNVGSVNNISLDNEGSVSFVKLELIIDTQYKKWVTDKSVVYATRDQNIISERVLNIDISQKGSRILENNEYLAAGTAQDIETVLKTANELIASINQLVIAADTLLGMIKDTNTTVGMLLGSRILYNNLDFASVELNKLLSSAGGLMVDVDGMFKIVNSAMPKAMAFADTLSSSVMGLMGGLDDLTGRASILMNSLDTTMRNVGGMVNDMNSMVGSVGNIITDGSQTLNKADDLVGGVSKFWFIRGKIPKKDTIPLLEEAW
ncbi:MAG: MlaD family protein [Fibromonadales bacterium]|nr:MlaD family protein [Fibromonadales bacterium]